jgi:hypothetical protein
MKKVMVGVSALALVFLVSGCGDSPDSVMKDQIKVTNELLDVLEGIKTKEDAEKAKPKLEELGKKMKDIQERSKKLKMDDMPKEKKEALQKKYKDDIEKLGSRFFSVLAKLNDPAIQKVLKDVDLPKDFAK